MACGKTVFFLLAILGCLAWVPAEEVTVGSSADDIYSPGPELQTPIPDGQHDRAQPFGFFPNPFNSFSQFFGNGSDPFSSFGQLFSGFGGSNNSGFPNLFSGFLPHSGRSQRLDLLPSDLGAENGTEDSSPHDRFFFSLFNHFGHSVPIGCNYTTQAGYSCAGCREQLICNANNVGRIRICPFYAPYCYNGVCGSYVNTTCTNSTG